MERIVGEVSVTWRDGKIMGGSMFGAIPNALTPATAPISVRFEYVIRHNEALGYRLESWQFVTTPILGDSIIETIIAVFVK